MADQNDIVQQITTDATISAGDATHWLNAVVTAITKILTTDQSVTVPGLGTFTVTVTNPPESLAPDSTMHERVRTKSISFVIDQNLSDAVKNAVG